MSHCSVSFSRLINCAETWGQILLQITLVAWGIFIQEHEEKASKKQGWGSINLQNVSRATKICKVWGPKATFCYPHTVPAQWRANVFIKQLYSSISTSMSADLLAHSMSLFCTAPQVLSQASCCAHTHITTLDVPPQERIISVSSHLQHRAAREL